MSLFLLHVTVYHMALCLSHGTTSVVCLSQTLSHGTVSVICSVTWHRVCHMLCHMALCFCHRLSHVTVSVTCNCLSHGTMSVTWHYISSMSVTCSVTWHCVCHRLCHMALCVRHRLHHVALCLSQTVMWHCVCHIRGTVSVTDLLHGTLVSVTDCVTWHSIS